MLVVLKRLNPLAGHPNPNPNHHPTIISTYNIIKTISVMMTVMIWMINAEKLVSLQQQKSAQQQQFPVNKLTIPSQNAQNHWNVSQIQNNDINHQPLLSSSLSIKDNILNNNFVDYSNLLIDNNNHQNSSSQNNKDQHDQQQQQQQNNDHFSHTNNYKNNNNNNKNRNYRDISINNGDNDDDDDQNLQQQQQQQQAILLGIIADTASTTTENIRSIIKMNNKIESTIAMAIVDDNGNFSNDIYEQNHDYQNDSIIIIGPDIEYIHFRDGTRFWVQRVLVPIIMIIGIIGNSITMIIMTRRRMRSSTNWYLAALAIFDMIYLIFTFILSLKHYPNAHSIDYYYYWNLFPYFTMITDASSNTSVWLTVTFTIERYIAVCHPIKGKIICTESRAKRVILCVFIICLSVTLPTPFEWIIVERFDNQTQSQSLEAEFSELGNNQTYRNIYYHMTVFLFVLLPLILLVIFNSFLIRSVHISNRERSRMIMGKEKQTKKSNNRKTTISTSGKLISSSSSSSNTNANANMYVPSTTTSASANATAVTSSSSRQEIRITIMLIAVVILFIICQTPTAVILVYTAFNQYDGESNNGCILVALSNIFNLLMSINSAGNFVLYCLLSQKYRRTFVNMFCPCLAHQYIIYLYSIKLFCNTGY
ncbi:class a rhodopsin-like protein g-protein coupled receptor gprnna13-like protein [Dermatophagoides farinae]|uniref:Class a rhodopsin-like protein g-protein coupled receptor gprnna13-like protein n=1 Tax=Dermatophagoides farinae TaxID=6954 RepID=A0A9D4SEC8_DERFA|nr:class a rhodopsin-like protein g-protein coupled receptor gprnna13-like protein [Dermatophagoides farinae]